MTEIPEQNGGSSPAPVPAPVPVKDRRLHVRQRVSSLTYVDLGEDNGGIVLNVSEAGIRIQAAAALEQGPVAIRLQLPGTRKRLEVSAEVVWVGKSRKEAGLRFVDLSEDAQRQIRKWIAREMSPDAPVEEDESESEAEETRAAPIAGEEFAAGSAFAALREPMVDDELGFDDDVEERGGGRACPRHRRDDRGNGRGNGSPKSLRLGRLNMPLWRKRPKRSSPQNRRRAQHRKQQNCKSPRYASRNLNARLWRPRSRRLPRIRSCRFPSSAESAARTARRVWDFLIRRWPRRELRRRLVTRRFS